MEQRSYLETCDCTDLGQYHTYECLPDFWPDFLRASIGASLPYCGEDYQINFDMPVSGVMEDINRTLRDAALKKVRLTRSTTGVTFLTLTTNLFDPEGLIVLFTKLKAKYFEEEGTVAYLELTKEGRPHIHICGTTHDKYLSKKHAQIKKHLTEGQGFDIQKPRSKLAVERYCSKGDKVPDPRMVAYLKKWGLDTHRLT